MNVPDFFKLKAVVDEARATVARAAAVTEAVRAALPPPQQWSLPSLPKGRFE